MLTDDDLTRLLEEAGSSYDVPLEGPDYVLEERADGGTVVPLFRRRWVQLSAAAAVLVVGALVAQSVGNSPLDTRTTASENSAALDAGRDGGAPASVASQGGSTAIPSYSGGGGTTGGTSGAVASAPQVAGGKAVQQGSVAATVDDTNRVVKTGTVTLLVDKGKVSATVQGLQAVVTGARGFIANQSSQEIGSNPSATLTMRVPVASFESIIKGVRGLGAKVVSVESSGKDVTAEYADTAAQIASLKAARARFLTILSGARTIGETLSVQQRVDEVQGRIDRLEGQRRVLANQSDLATLTVSVSEKDPTALATKERSGFGKAWDDAKDGFTSGVQALVAHSGRALLVLLVGAVAFVVLRLGWRFARRRFV